MLIYTSLINAYISYLVYKNTKGYLEIPQYNSKDKLWTSKYIVSMTQQQKCWDF